jgi:hypothetical protein
MKKLTKTEMKKLKAQLNEMDYGVDVEALLNNVLPASPNLPPKSSADICRLSAVYGA